MINTIAKRAQNDETHDISAPLNILHTMTVRSDPTTGRLLEMPEPWGAPPTTSTTEATDQKSVSQSSFWGAVRREIKAQREYLTMQLSRSSSTSHPPVRRNSRSHQASFSKHRTKTPGAAGGYELGQTRLTDTEMLFRPLDGSAPVRAPSTTARPRRKAVPKLTEEEWKEINAPRIPRVHWMPPPLLGPTTFRQAPHPQPYPYASARGHTEFPRQGVPMYPPVPVFFVGFDDLAFPR
jgi:hypothetical protein